MKYQILDNNQLIEINEAQYNRFKEHDERNYNQATVSLDNNRETITFIPFQNMRFTQSSFKEVDLANRRMKEIEEIKREQTLEDFMNDQRRRDFNSPVDDKINWSEEIRLNHH